MILKLVTLLLFAAYCYGQSEEFRVGAFISTKYFLDMINMFKIEDVFIASYDPFENETLSVSYGVDMMNFIGWMDTSFNITKILEDLEQLDREEELALQIPAELRNETLLTACAAIAEVNTEQTAMFTAFRTCVNAH